MVIKTSHIIWITCLAFLPGVLLALKGFYYLSYHSYHSTKTIHGHHTFYKPEAKSADS